jgi:glucose dehydrogenase
MKLKKAVAALSVALVVGGMAMPVWAQQDKFPQKDNPYLRAAQEDEALRTETIVTDYGTLIRYKENPLPKVDQATSKEWQLYGLDLSNSRYSDLDQVNQSNIKSLSLAWVSQQATTGNNLQHSQNSASQCTPTVVNGIMYTSNYPGDIFAVNAETGRSIWTFRVTGNAVQPALEPNEIPGLGGLKAIVYGDGVLYTTAGPAIYAHDPATGNLITSFGNGGRVDAALEYIQRRFPDIVKPEIKGYNYPNAVQYYDGVVYAVAGMTEDGCTGGLITALDAKTGKTLWFFNTIPQDATDPYWDLAGPTWKATELGQTARIGGSAWQTPAIDVEQGLYLICTSNPSPLPDGSRRAGLNLFTNCLMALDLKTGKLKEGWGFDYTGDGKGDGFFQAVHHDIWDFDWAQNPILFDTTVNGQPVKGVASACKNGLLYMFDRTTGKAFPGTSIQEVPVQAWSNRPGEQPWPTQPFQYNTFGGLMNTTPIIATNPSQAQLNAGYQVVPPYTPPLTIRNAAGQERGMMTPSFSGGTTGGAASCSPRTGLLYFHGIDSPSNAGRPSRSYVNALDNTTGSKVC